MSAISSVGTSSSSLYLTAQANGADSADDSLVGASSTTTAASGTTSGTATISPLADLRSQIETAVTDAIGQLPAGSSPQDILDAVRSSVEETLKANGLDPGQLGGSHHHHSQGVSGGAGAFAGSNPDGEGDPGQQSTADPLLAALQTPNSTDAIASLVQQLTGDTNAQSGQSGNPSGKPNSLLDVLQSSTTSGPDLNSLFLQLFQGFPNGSGLDVHA